MLIGLTAVGELCSIMYFHPDARGILLRLFMHGVQCLLHLAEVYHSLDFHFSFACTFCSPYQDAQRQVNEGFILTKASMGLGQAVLFFCHAGS